MSYCTLKTFDEVFGTDYDNGLWKPKAGDLVAVSDNKYKWYLGIFFGMNEEKDGYGVTECEGNKPQAYWKYCEPATKRFPELRRIT